MELCPRCGAQLSQRDQQCPLCHTPGMVEERNILDPARQMDDGTGQEIAVPGAVPPGPISTVLERWMARPGGRGQVRAALSLLLVVALLGVSVAAWWTFVHSVWGARLSGIDQILFVGGKSNPVGAGASEICETITDGSGTVSNCSASTSAGAFPANPAASFSPGQLYVMHPDGSGLHQLTNTPGVSYLSPVWSPDGSRIATFLVSSEASVAARLELLDANGADVQIIPSISLFPGTLDSTGAQGTAQFSRLIEWSPNGSQLIALLGARQFGLIQADGTNLRQFTGSEPAWSPDGRYLAYFVYGDVSDSPGFGAPSRPSAGIKIEILDTQTFQTRQLDNLPTPGGQALAWSPNGRYLAFDATQGEGFQAFSTDTLMLVHTDGSDPTPIAQWGAGRIEQIAWSPDSRQIAAVVSTITNLTTGGWQAGTPSLWVVNADNSNLRKLTFSDSEQPSWAPDGQRLVFASPDDNALMIANTTAQPNAALQAITLGIPSLFAPCWSPLAGL